MLNVFILKGLVGKMLAMPYSKTFEWLQRINILFDKPWAGLVMSYTHSFAVFLSEMSCVDTELLVQDI